MELPSRKRKKHLPSRTKKRQKKILPMQRQSHSNTDSGESEKCISSDSEYTEDNTCSQSDSEEYTSSGSETTDDNTESESVSEEFTSSGSEYTADSTCSESDSVKSIHKRTPHIRVVKKKETIMELPSRKRKKHLPSRTKKRQKKILPMQRQSHSNTDSGESDKCISSDSEYTEDNTCSQSDSEEYTSSGSETTDDNTESESVSEEFTSSGSEYTADSTCSESDSVKSIRKRTPHIRVVKKKETVRPRRQCPVQGCLAKVVNIKRHIRSLHLGYNYTKPKPKRLHTDLRKCSVEGCSTKTVRMDLHLYRVHKIGRGTDEYLDYISRSERWTPEKENKEQLDRCLKEYSDSMKDRARGAVLTPNAAQGHITAIRTFLPGLSKSNLLNLVNIGKPNGRIDEMLKCKRLKPDTIKTYLGYMISFCFFLESSQKWLRTLNLSLNEMQSISPCLKNMVKSLKADIEKRKVERAQEIDEDLGGLEPWMVGRYMSSKRIHRVRELLKKGPVTTKQKLMIRDSLCTQIIISNAKRAGDPAHITTESIRNALLPDEDGMAEIFVAQHKEAKSGKKCPILLSRELLISLKKYAKLVQSRYIFMSQKGEELTPSAMSKLIQREWSDFGKEENLSLPKITASLNRKLSVSSLRSIGSTATEQQALAKHMAHNYSTAQKYYDKSLESQARRAVVRRLNNHYQTAANQKTKKDYGVTPCYVSLKKIDVQSSRLS